MGKKIALLSNVTVGMILPKLKKYDVYVPSGFDTWISEIMNPTSELYTSSFDAVFVLLDGFPTKDWDESAATENVDEWKNALNKLAGSVSDIPVFISSIAFNFSNIRSVAEINPKYDFENKWIDFIRSLSVKHNNIFCFDVLNIIRRLGTDSFYSPKMWYLGAFPYSKAGTEAIADEIRLLMEAAFESRRKIVALDLDNTMWGGVVGEDGASGISLSSHLNGEQFRDFQRNLLEMKKRGVLLSVLSKNNKEDADFVFEGHKDMLVHYSDLVAQEINWENKPENLRKMADKLNLTEGSFTFVDDNPSEREQMKAMCPDVYVPDFPDETVSLPAFSENIFRNLFMSLRLTAEDNKKTEMYQAEQKRNEERSNTDSLDDYLKKLQMEADIHRMRPEETDRVTQLCNKTNQFNLTTIRYTKEELIRLQKDDNCRIYTVSLKDKYGDSGLVGVVITSLEGKDAFIDTFLMSCRVMGRRLEEVIISTVAGECAGRLIGKYVPTAKNKPVANLYEKLGFIKIDETDDGICRYGILCSKVSNEATELYHSIKSDME